MKVLLIPEQFPTTANEVAGIFMRDYIKAINRFGACDVFYTCAFKTGDILPADAHLNIQTYFYQNFRPSGLIRAPKYFFWEKAAISFAKLNIDRPDLIYLHGASLRGNIAARLAQYWRVPLVITEHTGPWSAVADRIMVLRRVKQAISRADALLPVSHHLLNEMQESGIRHPQVKVLGNPVDTEFFRPAPDPGDKPANFLFLGRMDEFKGALRTLNAFHKARKQLPGWSLTLAGDGVEKRDIETYVTANGLEGVVKLLPFQSRSGMRDLLYQSRCLLFPGRFESFGLVGAEALSTGTPVIITNRTGPLEYFTDTCGFAVDPDNVDAIAQAMQKMAVTYAQFEPHDLHRHISGNFGIMAFAKKLHAVFERVLNLYK